jgi:alanine dehydrogenase
MIMKVKEPIAEEYARCRKNKLVFTYFAFCEPVTHAMIESESLCLAYETVEQTDRYLPLLMTVSEMAGRMAIQEGARYLQKPIKKVAVYCSGVYLELPRKSANSWWWNCERSGC